MLAKLKGGLRLTDNRFEKFHNIQEMFWLDISTMSVKCLLATGREVNITFFQKRNGGDRYFVLATEAHYSPVCYRFLRFT